MAAGLDGFHDYEIIELLLTIGTPRKDCKDTAKRLLSRFRSLQNVLEADAADLQSVDGVGPKNAFGLKLIKAVANRYREVKLINQDPISDSRALYDYLRVALRDKQRELFQTIFLNAKNRVIAAETHTEGSLTASSVYPREVVAAALRHHAAALIVAHNHPSGDPQPSAEDVAVTRRLVWASRVMDIRMHEHIIIGSQGYFSFADHGIIATFNEEFDRYARQNGALPSALQASVRDES